MVEPTDPEQPAYDRWSLPEALSTRGYVIVVAVVVLIAAAGFGVVSLISAGGETASGVTVRLPVSAGAAETGGDSAVVAGVLRVDDQKCVYVEAGQEGDQPGKVWAVWPAGYHARLDGNRLSLVGADGKVVAVDGDRVQMSTVMVPASTFTTEPCLPDSGQVAVVQSDVTVVQ